MRRAFRFLATAALGGLALPLQAQDQIAGESAGMPDAPSAGQPIIVTAQRQAERLQEVPVAVSAFTAEALEQQQIESVSDLQLFLPNIAFSKGPFAGSSFAIRGVGNLCVGATCDSAIGIHVNDMPLLSTRSYETEYFDIERIEVLRGPQGTLFGRNATSGVINTITARPDLSGFEGRFEAEYGNYDSIRAEGMINLPLSDWAGIRLAGIYVNRDGYTRNLFDNSRVDDRDLYALRGSLRIEPGPDTTLDIIGYYFRENDNRSRIQKQLCARDPTGILGCSPDALRAEPVNANATVPSVIASRETLGILGGNLARAFGLGSIYGPDIYLNAEVPTDLRTINADFAPTYFADEWFVMGRLEQAIGALNLTVTGGYHETSTDTRTDFNITAADPFGPDTGRAAFQTIANFAANPIFGPIVAPAYNALLPQGPDGPACVSEADLTYAGLYGGNVVGCADRSIEYDRSATASRQWSIEAQVGSDFDGPFNFLLGAIYVDDRSLGSNYFVSAFGVDYAAAVLGALQSIGTGTPSYLGPSFFNNETPDFSLHSFGLFGEGYVDLANDLTLTAGLRYSHDSKRSQDRSVLLNTLIPFGTTDVRGLLDSSVDFDPSIPGSQPYRELTDNSDALTGRVVLDWQWTPDNLLYASYSRGYKSGGINPPFDPVQFPNAPVRFSPEAINAFEIGSKNSFFGGGLQLNATAFYYDYKDLQLNRIINRTSFNDNTDAEIFGFELEAVFFPDPAWMFNLTFSLLETSIGAFELVDSRDPSGGRSDVVIIKDLMTAANCAVIPDQPGNAAGANAFVNAINAELGQGSLQPTVPVPGTGTTGAYSICAALAGAAAGDFSAYPALAGLQLEQFGSFTVDSGAPVNIAGNQLPQAPDMKLAVGGQYTHDFANGMSLVARADYAYTGRQWARSFNLPIDRVSSYEIVNAQLQLNGADDRWFLRAFVQNLFDSDAVTGIFVQDPSVGLFTNVFTLEPRRYGLAAGIRF